MVQLQYWLQLVSSIIKKEGEESTNREITYRYRHSRDKDICKMGLRSHYHSVESHHGNEVHAICHYVHLRRHLKRKRDGNVLQGALKKIKLPYFDG